MTTEILAPVTDAGASEQIAVTRVKPHTFHAAPVLVSAEKAQIQFKGGNGTFYDLFVDGSIVELNATTTMVTISAPGVYRVDKEASVAETGIYVEHDFDL